MPVPRILKERYEIREILGQGGMGLVFRAYDTVVRREVALKTLRDTPTRSALQMFYKECEVLASLSHPNIIDILDIGEFEEDGASKPFFVMPLLPGAALDTLIRDASHRLTVECVVDIVCQVCRGLHAAHERGLLHRDMKPSNIFVMDDDSVKIIDFGVAHMAETGTTAGPRGTLLYMSPEQIRMQPLSPASDIFSLGVVCYEALTRRRPFEGSKEFEIVEAILHSTPPPASSILPAVGQTLSRVVHKALAKQPWSRYSSAREFGETLQKALRNEPIDFFNPARLQPRIERASKAFEEGDLQFAAEIVGELEAEGHLDPAIPDLRRRIDAAARQKTISQLLESARTRFDHQEYPLALQKLDEVLLLDPANAQALGIKASIEGSMNAQKVEEWLRLAREHLEHQAFGHARAAVENVFPIKANEPRAQQLIAEIARSEQDYNRSRKDKEDLYESALAAYSAGEVTTALSKLERVLDLDRRSPESGAGRAAAYQNFYHKVRSEHETLKNSFAEARKHLADRNFAQALAIADDFLSRYPGHALFQALKFDIEEQQRQDLSARVAEVEKQVEAEPDLDRRVSILEQAIAEFPGEAHFERLLKPLQEKRDLVNSIAAKARYHEERGQFAEAQAQWEILKTIYSQYPGLAFELDRVTRRREQAALSEAKTRWIEQIDSAVSRGDYVRAGDLASRAEAEFPGDADFSTRREHASQAAARAAEAQKLLAQGQALCSQRWFDEGLGTLRRALEMDPNSAAIRAALLEALVDRARTLVDTDWRSAEPLIQYALEIDPQYAPAKGLRISALDHKRDEIVTRSLTEAGRLRAAGDLAGALAEAEQCLAQYPLDPRIQQLRDILARELREQERKRSRPADLDALKALEQQAAATADAAALAALGERARAIGAGHAGDPEFQLILAGIEERIASLSAPPQAGPAVTPGAFSAKAAAGPVPPFSDPGAAAEPVSPSLTATMPLYAVPEVPAAGFSEGRTASAAPPSPADPQPPAPFEPAGPNGGATPPPVLPASPTTSQILAAKPLQIPVTIPPQPPRSTGKARARTSAVLWTAAGLLAVAALFLAGIMIPRLRKQPAPPQGALRIEIRTTPPGAVIRVNGRIRGTSNFQLEIPPGVYQLDATLDGYQPLTASITLSDRAAAPVELALQPLPHTVRLFTDMAEGRVVLDSQPARALVDGQITLDSITPGAHTMKIASRGGEASFEFEAVPGAAPVLKGAPAVRNLSAVLVSSFGNRARLYSSIAPAKVTVDTQPAADLVPGGTELTNLAPGQHDLTINDGSSQVKRVIEIGPAPVLTAFFQSDRNIGTLVVLTGEDGVDVYIDGRKYPRQTRGGVLRIPEQPKEYRIRVEKNGFAQIAEQTVQIVKGEEKKVEFNLVAVPATARLAIQGALPGADVLLDQASIGTVQPDGTFQTQRVPPGDHTLELRKEKQRSRPVRKTFAAGQTVHLADADLAIRPSTGSLRVSVTPATAQVTITRAGGQPRIMNGPLEVEEGAYTIAARAPGYAEATTRVQIGAGQTVPLNIVLAREQRRASANSMDGWGPSAWTQDGDWWVRRGGGVVLYRSTGPGIYAFNIVLASGGGLLRSKSLEWVANYNDDRNYVLYRLERDNLRRLQVANGRRTELLKKPHGLDFRQHMLATLQLEVAPTSLVVRARNGDRWIVLDSWSAPGLNFTLGRFGILVNGKDEVRISGFSYFPKE